MFSLPKFDSEGRYITNPKYTEIIRLHEMLDKAGIPHTFEKFMDGWQVCYPQGEDCVMDAIQHCGSYGRELNLLEIMGLLTTEEAEHDSVVGWLNAEDVFERIRKHYSEVGNEKKEKA